MTEDSNQYRRAGVNIAAGNDLAARIQPAMRASSRHLAAQGAALLSAAGGFAAAVRLPPQTAPSLVVCTDGVGTKAALLAEYDMPETAGIDAVAMCVNDLLCAGARPLLFLDYYACDSLSPDFAARVIAGVARGCEEAGCALVGGETAEMPGVYAKGAFDIAGFAAGIAEEAMLFKTPPAAGDALVAVASSGPHSNGYSLIRRILRQTPPPPDMLTALLAPTRIYCAAVAALRESCPVRGLAHITGGGIAENLPRILAAGTAAQINLAARPRPPVFSWLQKTGEIGEDEMRRVFNCGIGMLAAVAPQDADAAIRVLQQNGEDAWRAGEIIAAEDSPRVIFQP